MTKTLLLTAALVLVAIAVPPASSAHAPLQDAISGDALFGYDGVRGTYVRIDARSGPSGESPAGNVSINLCSRFINVCGTAFPESGGRVTCLNARGNRAILAYYGGVVSVGFSLYRARGLVEVIDNASSSATPDVLNVVPLLVPDVSAGPAGPPNPNDVPITDCPDSLPPPPQSIAGPLPARPIPDVLQDFTVSDVEALPTLRGQCTHGGWRAFGVFKNRKDCIGFVRHRARQACIFERAVHGRMAFWTKYGLGRFHVYPMRRCIRQRIGSVGV
jgi:hypothetical protein